MGVDTIPKISVIIPAYNVERYIYECLASVRSQTLKNFEVIIINDGSSDQTDKVIKKFAVGDKRFKVYNQKNKGTAVSRNRGIYLAKGEFIYFLDADDSIHPEMLETCVCFSTKNNLDILHFNASILIESESKIEHIENNNYIRNFTSVPANFYKEAINSNQYKCSVCLYIIRSEFLKKSGVEFISNIIHEDEGFTLKLTNLTKKQGFLKQEFFIRRVRPDSIMTKLKTVRNYEGYFQTFCDLADWYFKSDIAIPENKRLLKKHIGMFYLIAMRGYITSEKMQSLRALFWKNYKSIFYYVPIKNAIAALFPNRIARYLMK